MKIVVVESLYMDLVVRMPQIPCPGETMLGEELKTFPGDKGANQVVVSARLGSEVTMIGCDSKNALKREMQNMLVSEGYDSSHLHVHQQSATGIALIQGNYQRQNSIAVASGVNFHLTKGSSFQ